jgi:hypothetical protein
MTDPALSIEPPPSPEPPPSSRAPRAGFWQRFLKNLSVHDYAVFVFFTIMFMALLFGTGPKRVECMGKVVIDVGLFILGLVLTRGYVIPKGTFINSFGYRVVIFCAIFIPYFQLRDILPAVSLRSVDAEILAFDLRVFGFEPALAWDKYVTYATTEWFAFFYFGYFFVLTAHVVPIMLVERDPLRLAHFTLGIMLVFFTGHLVYMAVPGWGPYHHLAGKFAHPLEGGYYWALVRAAVDVGGAQKDIFPSLHTAAPTYLMLYSFMHRQVMPFRITWVFVLFAATQIIIATMFLRWHYLIDIFAGLTLATVAAFASRALSRWDIGRRDRAGLAPPITALDWIKK